MSDDTVMSRFCTLEEAESALEVTLADAADDVARCESELEASNEFLLSLTLVEGSRGEQ